MAARFDHQGDATSIIKGGGEDLTRKVGQVKRGDEARQKKNISPAEKARAAQIEKAKLEDMKSKLLKLIDQNAKLKPFKNQLKIDITDEGLRIQIIDDQNRPMFDSGSAVMKPYTRDILHEIGRTLNELPNRISLSGHTDAIKYTTGERGYSNWELSADRANASRRELVAGGLEDGKIMRVVGLGSAVPYDKAHPDAPINRRISIIVMNKQAEEAITKAANQIEGSTATEIGTQLEQHQ